VTEQQIPQRVRAFIADHIDSVLQLEVLLLLHAAPDRHYLRADVARELRIAPEWVQKQLVILQSMGLLESQMNGAEPRYHYHPKSADLSEAVDGLAAAYADYRVTVTSLIFATPKDQLRSFADAFRLRNQDADG